MVILATNSSSKSCNTEAYVSVRQHLLAFVSIRQHSACFCLLSAMLEEFSLVYISRGLVHQEFSLLNISRGLVPLLFH
jgi:hypothetical protein